MLWLDTFEKINMADNNHRRPLILKVKLEMAHNKGRKVEIKRVYSYFLA
jgi:hypothetical protein